MTRSWDIGAAETSDVSQVDDRTCDEYDEVCRLRLVKFVVRLQIYV